MTNAVKYWKDFLLYFTTLETYCDMTMRMLPQKGVQSIVGHVQVKICPFFLVQ